MGAVRTIVSKFFADRGTHLAAMIAYFALLSFVLSISLTAAQSETAVVTGRLFSAEGTAAPRVRVVAVLVPEVEGTEVVVAFSETDASGAYRSRRCR